MWGFNPGTKPAPKTHHNKTNQQHPWTAGQLHRHSELMSCLSNSRKLEPTSKERAAKNKLRAGINASRNTLRELVHRCLVLVFASSHSESRDSSRCSQFPLCILMQISSSLACVALAPFLGLSRAAAVYHWPIEWSRPWI
ncbi:hypothetical protein PABG_06335 [Paracoccidioides brasiliensis Pb03]|nr:hypothetical protein PABG_06335 [Paracoccidioides brasiliensis Pb03]